jgi:hypothetical protein
MNPVTADYAQRSPSATTDTSAAANTQVFLNRCFFAFLLTRHYINKFYSMYRTPVYTVAASVACFLILVRDKVAGLDGPDAVLVDGAQHGTAAGAAVADKRRVLPDIVRQVDKAEFLCPVQYAQQFVR